MSLRNNKRLGPYTYRGRKAPDDAAPAFEDRKSQNIAEAYPSGNVSSTLKVFVPTTCVLSASITIVAFYHSSHQKGKSSEADFYQLISNSLFQLLSNLILVLPTIYNSRLHGHAWFWTWSLALVSTVCAVLAVPLYLIAPTEWSMVVGCVASVAAAFSTLQLVEKI